MDESIKKISGRYWQPIDNNADAGYVIASAEAGKAFRHFAEGFTSDAHRKMLVDVVRGMTEQEEASSAIAAQIGPCPFSAGNSSALLQWLDRNIQISDTGEAGSFQSWKDYWQAGGPVKGSAKTGGLSLL